ncbi:MAG: aminoacyl-tRNA hydrolase [Acidobacteriota bacterium]|jgi:PTH1 family peptidyl-tRNA hydrolase|nr:aminoacyl-tRNA hydrolase [Acidobacteriota bacterium]
MNSPDVDKNWLIIGLGNPGGKYENTRHNLGFMLVDLLADEFHTSIKRTECRSLVGQVEFENQIIELVKPQTYMNLSGEAVTCLLKKENRGIEKIIVVVDDLALPFGTIRLRAKGSDGGHNGLKSVSDCTKTKEFNRLRIGIQPDHPISNTKKFVLENFAKKDSETIEKVLKRSADAIRCVIAEGIGKAMTQYNG